MDCLRVGIAVVAWFQENLGLDPSPWVGCVMYSVFDLWVELGMNLVVCI